MDWDWSGLSIRHHLWRPRHDADKTPPNELANADSQKKGAGLTTPKRRVHFDIAIDVHAKAGDREVTPTMTSGTSTSLEQASTLSRKRTPTLVGDEMSWDGGKQKDEDATFEMELETGPGL